MLSYRQFVLTIFEFNDLIATRLLIYITIDVCIDRCTKRELTNSLHRMYKFPPKENFTCFEHSEIHRNIKIIREYSTTGQFLSLTHS